MPVKLSVLEVSNGLSSPDRGSEPVDRDRQLTQECPFLLDDEELPPPRRRRPVCDRCRRPCRVCICSALPAEPILLRSCHCVVLQHPSELDRKNRSLPFLQLSLHPSSLTTIVGRRFDANTCPSHLSHLLHDDHEDEDGDSDDADRRGLKGGHPGDRPRCWLIFPHPDAIPLSQALDELERPRRREPPNNAPSCQGNGAEGGGPSPGGLILLFLDGTWQLAGEMYRWHEWPPRTFRRVKLGDDDLDAIAGECPCRYALRTPPSPRHLSTHECISYVLSKVEGRLGGSQSQHPALYQRLLVPMDLAVQQYKHFLMANQRSKDDWSAGDGTPSSES